MSTGEGQHPQYFRNKGQKIYAKQGFQLTAVDISEEFITVLKRKVAQQKLAVEILQGNILSLHLTGSFDAAFCLGNSFGYFNHEGM